MKDKEKQIEEMKNCITCMHYYYCYKNQKAIDNGEVAHANLFKQVKEQGCIYYTHEDSVVIPKEISCYENIEKAIRTFRIDGNNVYFTAEQIMALTQIFHFKEKQENEIRKETIREYDDKLVAIIQHLFDIGQIDFKAKIEFLKENEKILKQFGVEIKE